MRLRSGIVYETREKDWTEPEDSGQRHWGIGLDTALARTIDHRLALSVGGSRAHAGGGFGSRAIDAAVRFCGGHVTGAPSADGTPGAHIIWDAYYSILDRSEVVEHYLDLLGADDHEKEADCDRWRIPGEGTTRLLKVCDAESRGPWNECDPPPEDAQCILLISMMIGGD